MSDARPDEQWKHGGDCTKCRRAVPKVYCRKICKEAIRMKLNALRLLRAMEKAQDGMRRIQSGEVGNGEQIPVDSGTVLEGRMAGDHEGREAD